MLGGHCISCCLEPVVMDNQTEGPLAVVVIEVRQNWQSLGI